LASQGVTDQQSKFSISLHEPPGLPTKYDPVSCPLQIQFSQFSDQREAANRTTVDQSLFISGLNEINQILFKEAGQSMAARRAYSSGDLLKAKNIMQV
jgi:hypothetical protein